MKKLKAILLGFALCMAAPLVADDFDWSQWWCSYGGGIEKGDMILSVDAAISPWTLFDGGFTPYVYADLEVACPIWKLPFTFGGYVGAGFHIGDDFWVSTSFGGSATYHVRLPPKNLDLYTGLKLGCSLDFGSAVLFNFWPGFNIGASWFFTDVFGVNLEIGYPDAKAGVVFKF